MKKWLIFAAIAAMFAVVMFAACQGGDDGNSNGMASGPNLLTKGDDGIPLVYSTPVLSANVISGTVSISGSSAKIATEVVSAVVAKIVSSGISIEDVVASLDGFTVADVRSINWFNGVANFVVKFQGAKGFQYNVFKVVSDDGKNSEAVIEKAAGSLPQGMIAYTDEDGDGVVESSDNRTPEDWYALVPVGEAVTVEYYSTGSPATISDLLATRVYKATAVVTGSTVIPSIDGDTGLDKGKFASFGVAAFNPGGYPLENAGTAWTRFYKIP
jgi:hypothetical protein